MPEHALKPSQLHAPPGVIAGILAVSGRGQRFILSAGLLSTRRLT